MFEVWNPFSQKKSETAPHWKAKKLLSKWFVVGLALLPDLLQREHDLKARSQTGKICDVSVAIYWINPNSKNLNKLQMFLKMVQSNTLPLPVGSS